jgi:glycosyltransferase involved in cell wall biosynthesis
MAMGFDILSFGRITWKKGLERLIRAIVYVPNARAVIAGHDEDGFAATLRGLAVECGVIDRILFLPRHLSGPDKETLFSAARVFVLPSRSENFGNVVAEAMIRGLPAVVTQGVGAAEILKVSGGGVVAEDSHVKIAAALCDLLQSDGQRLKMGAAAASYARKRLTWPGIAREFEKMYGEISDRRTRARAELWRGRAPNCRAGGGAL